VSSSGFIPSRSPSTGLTSPSFLLAIHPLPSQSKSVETVSLTLSIKRQNRLNRNVDSSDMEVLKHDLRHLLPVLLRVHGRFGEEDLPSSRVDLELLGEGVVPEEEHVVPVSNDSVLHRLGDVEEGTVLGSCEG